MLTAVYNAICLLKLNINMGKGKTTKLWFIMTRVYNVCVCVYAAVF